MCRTVKRGFKYRFYPMPDQAGELARTFGCVRLVYNKALEERTRSYHADGHRMSYAESSALLTQWKRDPELEFLAERSSVPLQQALRHLQTAFTNFFAGHARYPVFKSRKKSRQSAEYTRSGFTYRPGYLKLAKMKAPLRVVWSRPPPAGATPSTVTVSRDPAGRWFVSLRRARGRLGKAQRDLARKTPGSANREKARLRVARAYARVADQRRDFLHKLTTRLVRENQTVVIEDLAVRNLMKNHCLAGAISDAAWREFRRMLEYKADWYGRTLTVIGRWFPSSKICSDCGRSAEAMPLALRHWRCEFCGTHHDRDVNAARNLLAAGPAERVNACGADVRPQGKAPSPGGPSAMKQEPQRVTAGLPALPIWE